VKILIAPRKSNKVNNKIAAARTLVSFLFFSLLFFSFFSLARISLAAELLNAVINLN